ncbi:hypothetical protein WDU94_003257 [Cyamophila willieti]
MNWNLFCCLVVLQSVCGDYNKVVDINNGIHGNSAKIQVDKNAANGLVKIRADAGKTRNAFDEIQRDSLSTGPTNAIKPISSEPTTTFSDKSTHNLKNQEFNGKVENIIKDQKFVNPNKSKLDKNGMQRSLDNLKKKKKYGKVLDGLTFDKMSSNLPMQQLREHFLENSKINNVGLSVKEDVKHIIDKSSKGIPGNMLQSENGNQHLQRDLNNKQKEMPTRKQPVTLQGKADFDETENLIDDTEDSYDLEMKRLKKNLWLENMIPKSNKFLYNNKKYHEHLMAKSDAMKNDKYTKDDSKIEHMKRNKRSVLSSIFVQMPHEDDESDNIEDDYRYATADNEESRDKKSKGSTTVCLEIKSDPTKPPSTICGPEIKPNTPLDPHMYDMASNHQYIPNSDYYMEPAVDKTIWSLNPLHDPNYYSSLSNYKYQSTNRENHLQLNKHNNGNNKQFLDKNKMTSSSQVTTQDNGGYQQKKLSMTQSTLNHDGKSKTLKTMPLAEHNVDQDKTPGKTGLGQTPRNFLSGNVQDNSNTDMLRNDNFKDLDLNLDGAMSTNTNSFANPSPFQENQFDPNLKDQQNVYNSGNDFMSDPNIVYPSAAFADSVGVWRGMEQPFQDDMQLAMSYDQLYGLDLNVKTPQSFLEPCAEAKNVEQSENIMNSENSLNTDETNMPDESAPRSAYEYYPDRVYPSRPNSYPYVPPRPNPFRPRPYIYDRYDPDCRSGRCRSAEPSTQDIRNIADITDNIVGIPLAMGFGQYKGDAYYSGRPYPYRPTYEYEGSYPYSSRPYYGASYPYRPSYSGSTYPYDPNCRTADGRSCRESEEGKSANLDVNISPSVPEPNYALPSLPLSPSWAANNPRNKDDTLLGNPKTLPMSPSHVPVGLACNMIHAPVVPHHLIPPVTAIGIKPVIPTQGIGLGGFGHHGGNLAGSHGISSGFGTHSFNTGFATSGLNGLSLKDSHQAFVNVLSGVGSHGIGGSHSLVHHHLLGDKYQLAKETEDEGQEEAEEEIASKQWNRSETPKTIEKIDTKTKLISGTEELKSKIAEKLRAAEDKLKSTKSAILEKINKNLEKEKKIEENDDNDGSYNENKPTDAETKSTFSSPLVVPFPLGGGISVNSGRSNNYNTEARNIPFLTGSPNGSPIINLQTPLGGSITYDSPFFKYGILNRGFLGSPGFQNLQSGSSYQQALPQCTCQPGTTQCICPGTNGDAYNVYVLNRNFKTNLESSPLIYERTIVNPSAILKSQYLSENGPILGEALQEKSVVYNSPVSESRGTIESEQSFVKTPCMINKENQLMRSSVNENVQIAQEPVIQPIIAPVLVPQTPLEVSFRVPSYEALQYDMNGMSEGLQSQMYEYQPSPIVGFASLGEMKERENQLKQNYLGYENYDQQMMVDNKHNYNTYEDIYKESMAKQTPCNPETAYKNSEDSEVKTSNIKLTKKPALTELEKLPSKILTAKSLKLPTPILKLPKPNLKPLKMTQKEPCP